MLILWALVCWFSVLIPSTSAVCNVTLPSGQPVPSPLQVRVGERAPVNILLFTLLTTDDSATLGCLTPGSCEYLSIVRAETRKYNFFLQKTIGDDYDNGLVGDTITNVLKLTCGAEPSIVSAILLVQAENYYSPVFSRDSSIEITLSESTPLHQDISNLFNGLFATDRDKTDKKISFSVDSSDFEVLPTTEGRDCTTNLTNYYPRVAAAKQLSVKISPYNFQLTANDGETNPKTANIAVKVNVNPSDLRDPVFDELYYSATIKDPGFIGQIPLDQSKIRAYDGDTQINEPIDYNIIKVSGSANIGYIPDGDGIQLKLNQPVDPTEFENKYMIVVVEATQRNNADRKSRVTVVVGLPDPLTTTSTTSEATTTACPTVTVTTPEPCTCPTTTECPTTPTTTECPTTTCEPCTCPTTTECPTPPTVTTCPTTPPTTECPTTTCEPCTFPTTSTTHCPPVTCEPCPTTTPTTCPVVTCTAPTCPTCPLTCPTTEATTVTTTMHTDTCPPCPTTTSTTCPDTTTTTIFTGTETTTTNRATTTTTATTIHTSPTTTADTTTTTATTAQCTCPTCPTTWITCPACPSSTTTTKGTLPTTTTPTTTTTTISTTTAESTAFRTPCPTTTILPTTPTTTTTASTTTGPTTTTTVKPVDTVSFTQDRYSAEVIEKTPEASVVTVVASASSGAKITYSLEPNVDKFEINSDSGVILVSRTANLKAGEHYNIQVVATTISGASDTTEVSVYVVPGLDVCHDLRFDKPVYEVNLPEKSQNLTVAQLNLENAAATETIEITEVNPVSLFENFFMDGYVVKLLKPLNRSEVSEVFVTVVLSNNKAVSSVVRVSVEDVNEAPRFSAPVPEIIGYPRRTFVDPAVQMPIFTFRVEDPDFGDNARVTFTLNAGSTEGFFIDPQSGSLYARDVTGCVSQQDCLIQVRAVDGAGASATQSFSVNLLDSEQIALLKIRAPSSLVLDEIIRSIGHVLGYPLFVLGTQNGAGDGRDVWIVDYEVAVYAVKGKTFVSRDVLAKDIAGKEFNGSWTLDKTDISGPLPYEPEQLQESNNVLTIAASVLGGVLGLVLIAAVVLFIVQSRREGVKGIRKSSARKDSLEYLHRNRSTDWTADKNGKNNNETAETSGTRSAETLNAAFSSEDSNGNSKIKFTEEKVYIDEELEKRSSDKHPARETEDDVYCPESPRPVKSILKGSNENLDESGKKRSGVTFNPTPEVHQVPSTLPKAEEVVDLIPDANLDIAEL